MYKGFKHSDKSKEKMSKSLKGKKPWNKGLKGYRAGEKRPNVLPKGSKNGSWKGDDVGYRGLHKWVELMLGKPRHCAHCRNSNLKPRDYHWANISRSYRRDLSDWIRLCAKCHGAFDSGKISIIN